MTERLATVLAVLYLVFHKGYVASGEDDMLGPHLCDEAIRLGTRGQRFDAAANPYVLEINSMASLGLAGSFVHTALSFDDLVGGFS